MTVRLALLSYEDLLVSSGGGLLSRFVLGAQDGFMQ